MGLTVKLSLPRWVRRTDLVNPTGKVQLGILMASSPDSEVAQRNLQGSTGNQGSTNAVLRGKLLIQPLLGPHGHDFGLQPET